MQALKRAAVPRAMGEPSNVVYDDDFAVSVESPANVNSEECRVPVESPAAVHRDDIDGLRALAVLAVIVFHIDPALLPGGFTGVDCFFVISGFVVASSILRRRSTEALSGFLGRFYARRVKRLAPALLCVMALTGLELALFTPPEEPDLPGYYRSGQWALIGVANVHFNVVALELSRQRPPSWNDSLFNTSNTSEPADPAAEEDPDAAWKAAYFGRRLEDDPEPLLLPPRPHHPPPSSPPSSPPPRATAEGMLHQNPFMHTWSLGVEEQHGGMLTRSPGRHSFVAHRRRIMR